MAGWSHEAGLLRAELIQRKDEGCCIPADLERRVAALDQPATRWDAVEAEPLWREVAALTPDAALTLQEPDEWDAIRALCPPCTAIPQLTLSHAELRDRLWGAWTLRAVGCALGKPVEDGNFGFANEAGKSIGRYRIRHYLEALDEWPLNNYFSGEGRCADLKISKCLASTRERIAFMEPDDDMHYPLIALKVLEAHGSDFDWMEVARCWTDSLPFGAICTAETQAILNFWNHSIRWGDCAHPNSSATPAFCRNHKNPYREWIGAQIRSDGWAWACAGKPTLAAEFAYRDASWTHTRNGIYGALFFAAVQAAAFVVQDPAALIRIGLAHIPRNCRLARWIAFAQQCASQSNDYWQALELLFANEDFALIDPVHTLNNAAVCVLALLFSGPDMDAAVCNAVMAGLDTDCNGATIGSIVGAAFGMQAYSGSMAARLHDTMKPLVFGFTETTFTDLSRRFALLQPPA